MSKVIPFKIPKSQKEFVRFQIDKGEHFYDKLHQHPEWQLTFILEGKGQLMVGDYIGRFEPGDVFLLGANIPHVFRSDEEYFKGDTDKLSVSNTLFFDFDALGKGIWEVEEFLELKLFVGSIKGCFAVKGSTRNLLIEEIRKFEHVSGLAKILGSLEILNAIHHSGDLVQLNRLAPIRDYSEAEGNRMRNVMQFILAESQRNISLNDVSEVANMSKEAFCRFFKERTGKTFTEFLNELRIHKACHLLQETDISISQAAYQAGFQNLSYFNRAFKKFRGETPKEFRIRLREI
jgi:AraC-like DNA-binding protein